MKKLLLSSCLIVASFSAWSQRGEGGMPYSNKSDYFNNEVPFVTMQPFNIDSVRNAAAYQDSVKGPYKFGYNYFTNLNPDNSGTWKDLSNGDRYWRLGITCPEALSINLAFSGMVMPHGAKLFVYSADRKVVMGAFTRNQMNPDQLFGTELIPGEAVVVEYYEPAAVRGQGWLNVFRITHGFRGVQPYLDDIGRGFGDAGNCHNNTACPGAVAWADQARSVVCLVSGGSEFCTGALINNTCNDATPYVLTADHCGTANGSWVFRFNWQSATCADPSTNPSSQSLTGGTQRAAYGGSDVSLVQINQAIPSNYNVYFSGWNRVNAVVDSTVCIHHPSGDIKKISWAQNVTISSTYGGADCWRTTQWTSGVTEPGSSGSPLYDPNRRIIGQLYGGPSYCGAPTNSLNDYYGKFSTSWTGGGTNATRLSNWLDACNTGVTVLDGFDPNTPTVALDAQMNAVVTPSGAYTNCGAAINEDVIVVLRNAGVNTLTSCTITWQLDSNTPTVFNWTGSLNSNSTTQVNLGNITLPLGTHTVTVVVSNPNNGSDGNTANDQSSTTFTVTTLATGTLPVQDGFQSTTFPSAGWSVVNPNNDVTWVRTTAAGFNSSASMRIDNFNNDTQGTTDDLRTPVLDLTNAIAPITVTFDVAYARYSSQYSDTLGVYVSTDCGVTWIQVFLKGGSTLSTAPDNTNAFTPNANQWRAESINLSAYAGQSGVIVAFRARGGYGNFVYVDNINITSGTTSLNEVNGLDVGVYPNPSNDGIFTVEIAGVLLGNEVMEVTDLTGRVIFTQTLNGVQRQAVDLSGEAQGVYFVSVRGNKQTIHRRLLYFK